MLATVILASGPHQLHIDLIPGSEDNLTIIRKWKDDLYSTSIVAPIPGTDAWMGVCSPQQLNHPQFPRGHVKEALETQISKLPQIVEQFVAGSGNPDMPTLALAKYLGIMTDEQVDLVRTRKEKERLSRDAEWNRKIQEKEATEKAIREKEASELDVSYHGFLRGKTPLQVSKIRDALETQMSFNGIFMTRKEMVENEVSKGRKVMEHHAHKRIFVEPLSGKFYYQKDVTKTALDYAVFLGA